MMGDRDKYLLALGGFRRAVHALSGAADGLHAASHDQGPEPDDTTAQVIAECIVELRRMCRSIGLKQLLAAALAEVSDP